MEKDNGIKVFNYRPMVVCALSLILGIWLGSLFVRNNIIGAIILLILIFAIVIYYKFSNLIKFIAKHAICVCFSVVFLVYGFGFVSLNTILFRPYSKSAVSISASGTIVESGKNIVIGNLKATYYNSSENKIMHSQELDGVYYLHFADDYANSINFEVGEDVFLSGVVSFNKSLTNNGEINSMVFSYGIYGNIYLSYNDISKTGTHTKTETFDFIKNGAKSLFKQNLGETEANVAYAMVFGEKENLDSVYEDFKLSGMAHLLAVSGLHVGFFVAILTFICKLLHLKSKTKFFAVISVLFIYAWICGFSVSVTRAFIMTTCFMLSFLTFKQYDSLSSLSFSAIIILLIRPLDLFSLGFQLSFCAVLGIILLAKPLTRLFSKFLGERIGGAVAVTTSATIGTLPILITIYSRVSSLSLIVNLLAVPITSVAYMSLMVFSIIVAVLPFLRFIMAVPQVLIKALVYIAKITAGLDRAFIEFIPDKLLVLAVFLLAFMASDYVFLNKKVKRFFGVALALIMVFSAGIYAF